MAATPTVVLVHGAFADASGYAGVIRELQSQGVEVRAPMNPLRSLAFDADSIVRYTSTIERLSDASMLASRWTLRAEASVVGTFATNPGWSWPGGKSRTVTLAFGSLDMARQTTRP